MRVYSVQNEKGGCGKSTTSINIAYGLAKAGKRVLLVDNDPQANATSILLKMSKEIDVKGIEKMLSEMDDNICLLNGARETLHMFVDKKIYDVDISDVLDDPSLIHDAIQSTEYDNLCIIPSSHKLSESDMKLKNILKNSTGRLRMALDKVQDRFDVVIIDNSPFENALTYNSISACYRNGDKIIIPTKIDQGGLEGLDHTITTMIEWLEYGDLGYDFKILPTMVNRNNTDSTVIRFLQTLFKERVYKSSISYQAKPVVSASLKKEILLENNKESRVANDYRNLIQEILEELEV